MNVVISFSLSEADEVEPLVDRLVEAHGHNVVSCMVGMGTVDIELSGSPQNVSAFIVAAAQINGVHCTEQP